MKKFSVLILVLLVATAAFGQGVPTGFDLSNYGVRIEPDKRVMIVLATLEAARTTNAAGESVPVINTPLSTAGVAFREQLKSDLAAMPSDLRDRISSFVLRYKRSKPNATDAELVSPFISMAYTLTAYPEISDPIVTSDLPGALLDVLDFAPLVRDFQRRSSFSGNVNDYTKAYSAAADGTLRNSTREMVSELLNYLKTRPQIYFEEKVRTETQRSRSKNTKLTSVEIRSRERRFFVVPEMLAPTGTVNYVNVKDDYFVIVPPDTDLGFSEVRRAYLQFIIDPVILTHSKDIIQIRESVKKLLDEHRKKYPSASPDPYLAISRSLVASIDAKQLELERTQIATDLARQKIDAMKTVEEKRAVSRELETQKQGFSDETALRLSEDYERGAILVFYFSEQLKGIEDSGFDIAASMREMLLSFDATKETGRLDQFAAARTRATAAREEKKTQGGTVVIENPVTTGLIAIQETIKSKNYALAETELKTLLDKNPGEPRIFYNIGRVAAFQAESITDDDKQKEKLLEAKTAYENVLRIAQVQRIDFALVSLSYVALGKIYEHYGDKSYAAAIYDAAIKVGDVPGGAFAEAVASKGRLLRDQ